MSARFQPGARVRVVAGSRRGQAGVVDTDSYSYSLLREDELILRTPVLFDDRVVVYFDDVELEALP